MYAQEKLEGYYIAAKEGKNLKNSYARLIWFNSDSQQYEIGGNVVAQLISKSKDFRLIRDNIKDENFLREKFGVYAKEFVVEDSKEESIKEKIAGLLKEYEGKFLGKEEQAEITERCKAIGLTDNQRHNTYSFVFVRKYCEENKLCNFISKRKMVNGRKQSGWIISL